MFNSFALCKFNSFALAKPLCESMKIPALGSSARETMRHRGADAAIGWAGTGDVESDGVDRPLHVSRHHGRVPDHSCQLDCRDLVHAGDARFRPDHESAANAPRLRRHYRNDHSAPGDDDRADRAGHGHRACPQQAQLRFRDHRHERRRCAAVALAAAVPRRRHRGLDPGRRHRRLCLAAQPARIARLGRASPRRHSHQYRAAGAFHHDRRQSHFPHRRPTAERSLDRHFRR